MLREDREGGAARLAERLQESQVLVLALLPPGEDIGQVPSFLWA